MKKYLSIILLLVFLNYINAFAQTDKQLYIKVNTNDYLTCYGGFMYFDKIEPDIPMTLIFPQMEKKRVDYFIKNMMKGVKRPIPYIASDSLYKKFNANPNTEVILIKDGKEIKRWAIGMFDGDIKLNDNPLILASLPDSVILNNVSIGYNDNYFVLTDRVYNKAYLINNKTHVLDIIIGDNKLDALPFLELFYPNITAFFNRYRSTFTSTNTDKVRIAGGQKGGGKTILSGTLYYPVFDGSGQGGEQQVSIRGRSGIVCNISNDSIAFLPIDKMPDSLYFIGHTISIIGKDKFIADVISTKKEKYFLGEFSILSDKVVCNKIFPFIPHSNYNQILGQNVLTRKIIVYPYAMLNWSNELWNLKTEEIERLPLTQDKIYKDTVNNNFVTSFDIVDAVLLDDDKLRLLLYIDKNYFVKDVFLPEMKFINERKISTPAKIQSSIVFYGKDKVLYVVDEKIIYQQI